MRASPNTTRTWPADRRRPLAPHGTAPRESADPARIARCVVRRRAKGMDAVVAAALQDVRFDALQNSRFA
ncbi:hypothetical protein ACFUGD_03900 [Streptomyces sp. NPDC057217]|uniref:hypothetical protein n=1 Tax=Streptomyces sp. NPDC057217 TaxID=3346054 RepID=UPI0036361B42